MAKMPTPTFAMTAGEVPVAVKASVHVIEVLPRARMPKVLQECRFQEQLCILRRKLLRP